jgi:hypothetical protein
MGRQWIVPFVVIEDLTRRLRQSQVLTRLPGICEYCAQDTVESLLRVQWWGRINQLVLDVHTARWHSDAAYALAMFAPAVYESLARRVLPPSPAEIVAHDRWIRTEQDADLLAEQLACRARRRSRDFDTVRARRTSRRRTPWRP